MNEEGVGQVGGAADAGERIEASALYAMVLEAAPGTPRFLMAGNLLRGARLFLMQTELTPALESFGEIVSHAQELQNYFGDEEELSGLSFLIIRFRADVEVAVEALLAGRHGVLANTMRDVMEIELLLRDFALEKRRVEKWLTAGEGLRIGYFSPGQVRARLAAARYPEHRVDLPDSQEYAFHSKSLHATPNSPSDLDNVLDLQTDPGTLLFFSYEIVEHARRFFSAVYDLMRALGHHRPDLIDKEIPASLEIWERALTLIAEWTDELPPGVFPPREPTQRPDRRRQG